MTKRPLERRRTVDQDGVVRVDLGRGALDGWSWLLGLAALLALAGLAVRTWSRPGPATAHPRRHAATHDLPAESPAAPSPGYAVPVTTLGSTAEHAAPAPEKRRTIGGFPAPGTKPIKRGIVVPDDFTLPPGYVRHYQTTDTGRMLPAILVFHPDHQPLDARGRPLPLPADRVVPPEMAPAGLPVTFLEVPPDAYADPSQDGMDTDEPGTSHEP